MPYPRMRHVHVRDPIPGHTHHHPSNYYLSQPSSLSTATPKPHPIVLQPSQTTHLSPLSLSLSAALPDHTHHL